MGKEKGAVWGRGSFNDLFMRKGTDEENVVNTRVELEGEGEVEMNLKDNAHLAFDV